MEAKPVVILVTCLLLCFSSRGNAAACGLSDLAVTQTTVPGQKAGGYPEYLVTVENRCICTQTDVKLACTGFNSSIGVLPAGTISPESGGALCTLIGGGPVKNGEAVKFYYAWSTMFSLVPVASTVACSVLREDDVNKLD